LTRAENFVNARLIGDALAICAALLTAFYAYAYRELGKKGLALGSSSITFMTFSLGSVVLMAVACLVPATISWEALSGTNLPLFLGLAVLCTAIPSFTFAFASKRLPPVVTATISLLIPLFASAFAYLILGEKVPSTAIPGSALVIVGIVMILRGRGVTQKTNAARLLDQTGIRYELREYEVDPGDLAAETVAAKISLPPEQLFKTLVAHGDRHGVCMAVIPADTELDLKALAAVSGNRRIHLVPVKDLQKLTGYIRGGVTSLAAKKTYPVYVDNSIERFELISISAGIRGLQILLAPADYLRVAKATLAAIVLTKD
jgi:Cys-tRNA(Pro)/Cys-tRNA(Cys) deacylase